MRIDINEAQLKTATVQIQTLTISGKQVTLAVFRQLVEERILSDELDLLGIPWGVVNYHPDGCKDSKTHLHVVWQRGDELRRSLQDKPLDPTRVVEPILGSEWLNAAVLDGWTPKEDVGSYRGIRVRFEHGVASIWISDEAMSLLRFPSTKGYAFNCLKEKVNNDGRSREYLVSLVNEDIRQETQFRGKEVQRWNEFKALPQLFIAV